MKVLALTLCLFLLSTESHALSLLFSPGTDEAGHPTFVEQYGDRVLLEFGPVALFNLPPRTGFLIPTSWGFWLVATFNLTLTSSTTSSRLLARALPAPGVRLRWAPHSRRTDWTANAEGYGVALTSSDEVVARGRDISGPHQMAYGLEDRIAEGPVTFSIFLSAIEE